MDEQNTQSSSDAILETENTPTQSVQNDVSSTAVTKGLSGTVIVSVVVAAALVIAGLYYFFGSAVTNDLGLGDKDEVTSSGASNYPEVVAVVNNQEISAEDLTQSVTQVQQAAVQQNADITNPAVVAEIQSQALEVLVNTALLAQEAKTSGVNISDEDVTAELAKIASQYESPEAFATAIDQSGLSDEQLRENIKQQLTVNNYLKGIESVSAVTVSQEEIKLAYDSIAGQNENLPPLTEIAPALEQQLTAQKQQQAVAEVIQSLRDKAEIKILLDS